MIIFSIKILCFFSHTVTSAVLGYLVKQNRPYSAIDIFNNLHKAHGKTVGICECERMHGCNNLPGIYNLF